MASAPAGFTDTSIRIAQFATAQDQHQPTAPPALSHEHHVHETNDSHADGLHDGLATPTHSTGNLDGVSATDMGVSVGVDHIYEPFPITVRRTQDRGRIVVATRDVQAGEFVLRALHYTTSVSDEFKSVVCSSCFRPSPHIATVASGTATPLPERCEQCREVFFCSAACRAEAEHLPAECAALQHLYDLPRGPQAFAPDQWSEIRMMIKMAAKAGLEQTTGRAQHAATQRRLRPSENPLDRIWPPRFDDVRRLVPNSQMFSTQTQADVDRMARHVCALMQPCPLPLAEMVDLIYREKCNCFGVWDADDRCLAATVSPIASFFNHSCAPNASRSDDVNGVVGIRAAHPIRAGDEVTISYINNRHFNTAERRAELKSYYCFECTCPRCVDTTGECDAFVAQYVCKRAGCTGMLLPTAVSGSRQRKCRACPYTEPLQYEQLFARGRFWAPHLHWAQLEFRQRQQQRPEEPQEECERQRDQQMQLPPSPVKDSSTKKEETPVPAALASASVQTQPQTPIQT